MISIKQNILSSQGLSVSSTLQKKLDGKKLDSSKLETSINALGSKVKGLQKPEQHKLEGKYENRLRVLSDAEIGMQEGISMVQATEVALEDTDSILSKMRELALKSSDARLSDDDRVRLQQELKQLKAEIDNISSSAEYNNNQLLDGSGISVSAVSYASVTTAITINSQFSFNEVMAALKGGEGFRIPVKKVDSETLGLDQLEVSTQASAETAEKAIGSALAEVGQERDGLEGILSNLTTALSQMQSMSSNLFAAGSGTLDSVGSAIELMAKTKSQLQIDSSAVISAHLGSPPKNALSLLG